MTPDGQTAHPLDKAAIREPVSDYERKVTRVRIFESRVSPGIVEPNSSAHRAIFEHPKARLAECRVPTLWIVQPDGLF